MFDNSVCLQPSIIYRIFVFSSPSRIELNRLPNEPWQPGVAFALKITADGFYKISLQFPDVSPFGQGYATSAICFTQIFPIKPDATDELCDVAEQSVTHSFPILKYMSV